MAWAYMLVLCVLFAWRVESHRVIDAQQNGYERAVYPTALGDTAYYKPVGFDDFFAANVPCPGQTTGLSSLTSIAQGSSFPRLYRYTLEPNNGR